MIFEIFVTKVEKKTIEAICQFKEILDLHLEWVIISDLVFH